MPVKVQKDTYAYERVAPDAVVRREVFAGSIVPDTWFSDEEGTQPFTGDDAPSSFVVPPAYPHQVDPASGGIADEHAEDPDEQEQAARSQGGIVALNESGSQSSESTPAPASKSGSKSGS